MSELNKDIKINIVDRSLMDFPAEEGLYPRGCYGKLFSNKDQINVNVNKTKSGDISHYSINFVDIEYERVDIPVFVAKLLTLLSQNLKTGEYNISINYYECNDNDTVSPNVFINILKTADILKGISGNAIKSDKNELTIIYDENAETIDKIEDTLNRYEEALGNTQSSEDDDEDYVSSDKDMDALSSIFGDMLQEDPDDQEASMSPYDIVKSITGDNETKGKKNKNKSNKSYAKSHIFRESKNPKKEVKRHGVIIARDKDDIKKDEKTLKEFLKDFIPGKDGWVKDFREDLIERWMRTYTIKNKDLKKLQKARRKNEKDAAKAKKNKEILNFTRNIFNVPVSSWDDPTK